jgi:hypothetical protein
MWYHREYFAGGCTDEWDKINERGAGMLVAGTVAVAPLFGRAMTDPSCKVGGLFSAILPSFS